MTKTTQMAEVARVLASPLSAETDEAWAFETQEAVRLAVKAEQGFIHWPDSGRLITGTVDPINLDVYNSFYPLLRGIGYLERTSRLGVATRRDAYGPHYERMQGTTYTQEYLPTVNGYDSLALTVSGLSATAPSVQIILNRTSPTTRFEDDHVEVARHLYPAFVAGVAVLRQVSAARADLDALIDEVGGSCAIVGMDGRLRHLSRPLEAALARDPARADVLEGVMTVSRDALRAEGIGARRVTGARGVYRLSASLSCALRPLLIVAVEVPVPASRAEVAAGLGLTPRQAEVALLLAERRTNKEIAAALGVSTHTARHHVEAVLAALGVRRRNVSRALRDGRARELGS